MVGLGWNADGTRMREPYAKRLILHAPPWDTPVLATFVEDCVCDGVVFVAIVGPDCQRVEDIIDELVVGNGLKAGRFFNTTSHPNETLEDVRCLVAAWTINVDPQEPIQEVQLPARSSATGRDRPNCAAQVPG